MRELDYKNDGSIGKREFVSASIDYDKISRDKNSQKLLDIVFYKF
jgi:hypothetical protein